MPRIASVFLFFIVVCAAIANDYKLSVNASAEQLATAKALHIYGFSFQKGDRIVSVNSGWQGGATGYRVTLDSSGATGTMVADQHTLNGFAGKVLTADGPAPDKGVAISIDKVASALTPPQDTGVWAVFKGFMTSTSGFVTFGIIAALFIAAFLIMRPRPATGDAWALPNRRKSIDDSLKEIVRRLELIDEKQHELVRKPPVLRSFRNQIESFDNRLKQLESQLGSVQGLIVKTGESLGALDRGQEELKSGADVHATALRGLSSSVENAHQSVADLRAALAKVDQDQSARIEDAISQNGKQALELQNRLTVVDNEQQRSAGASAELHKLVLSLSEQIDLLRAGESALSDSVAQLQAGVDLAATKEVDLSPVNARIEELKNVAEALQKEQARVAQNLAELAQKEVDFAPVNAELAELKGLANSLQKNQVEHSEKLDAVAAKEVDLSTVRADLSELRGAAQSLHDDQGKLSEKVEALTAKEVDFSEVHMGIDELRAGLESIRKDQEDAQKRLTSLGKQLEAAQAKASEDAKAAMTKIAEAANGDDKKRLLAISDQQSKIEAGLGDLRGMVDKIQIPSNEKQLLELAGQQKTQAESLKKLSEQLSKLQDAGNHSAAAIEAKIADISTRTDQRESILLSLQNQASESEGKAAVGASEVLPMIADLRLELKALTADQTKVGATLENLAHAVSKIGSEAESSVQSLAEDQAKLVASLDELGRSMARLKTEPGELQVVPAFDDSKIQAALDSLSDSLGKWREEAEASQKSLEEGLRALAAAGAEGGTIAFDDSRTQAAIEALASSFTQWKIEAAQSQKALEERLEATASAASGSGVPFVPIDDEKTQTALESLSASLAEWKSESEQSHRVLEERLADATKTVGAAPAPDFRIQTALETFSSTLAQWKAEADESQRAFEARIASSIGDSGVKKEEHAPKQNVATSKSHADSESKEHRADEKHSSERPSDPPVAELARSGGAERLQEEPDSKPDLQIAAQEANEEPSTEESQESQSPNGWPVLGGSPSRRWSAPLERPFMLVSSEKHLPALTPIVTPSTEFKVGPMLYLGKKVLYGHGQTLRAMWPGRTETSATLQQELPAEPWRIAVLEGHAFCAEEDQVEIVSLATWQVVARFSGIYVDQVCTKSHWVGLSAAMNQLYLEYRNLQGRLLGDPVVLPFAPDDVRSLAAHADKIFIASRNGRLYRVELGQAKEVASAEKGDSELISMAVNKSSMVVLARAKDQDFARVHSFEGKLQRQMPLGFHHAFQHPVVIGDSLYLVDSESKRLASCNLKTMEPTEYVDLPGSEISAFCGVFHANQHALLLAVAEKDQTAGKVLAVDPKMNVSRVICEVNDRQIQIIAADARVVVASSTFYQNMIRIFDPFNVEEAQKAA